MCRYLPSNPNLDNIEKQARCLLHSLRTRDPAALRRYYSIDSSAGSSPPRLDDAQYILAREHGYGSWRKMKLDLDHTTHIILR